MGYRVVQWATGAMGTACLRAVIDSPEMELVGVLVHDERKVGRDAGQIARRAPTGVLATTSVDEILALDADVVVHAARLGPYGSHDETISRILESGKNVISINGYTLPAHDRGPRVDLLRGAAERGGATLMGAGLNPGFIGEQLAVVASGLCIDLEHVQVVETIDCRDIQQAGYMFGTLGFGTPLDEATPEDPDWGPARALNGLYGESIAATARGLGLELERVETDHLVHSAPQDVTVSAGTIRAGTVSHLNWRWHGLVAGARRLTMSIHWYAEPSHLQRSDPPLWELTVTGHPGLRVSVDLTKHPEDASRMSAEQYAVAGSVLNSIPVVCAADAGLLPRPMATPFRALGRVGQQPATRVASAPG